MNYDGRDGRNKLWAAVNSSFWGSYLSTSNDFGKTWTEPETYGVKFPDDAETSLKQIWQIVPGNSQRTEDTLLRRRARSPISIRRRGRNMVVG